VAVGRASDFYGPGAGQAAHLGERFFRQVLAGKPGQILFNQDTPHQRFRTRFGELATRLDAGAGATVAWARKAFGEAESGRAAFAAGPSARR
jgi:hypothetical protein